MKKTIGFHAICLTVALLAIAGSPARVKLQTKDQACSVENRNQFYEEFVESSEGPKKDKDNALAAAWKYLACPADGSDEQEARHNYVMGRMLILKNSSSEAIPYLIKAASYYSTLKTSPQIYADLAQAYEEGPYIRLSTAYTQVYLGKDETDESLVAMENINQIVDRMIDAYARAIALTGFVEMPKSENNSPRGFTATGGTNPTGWLDRLTELFRYRHKGSAAGMKEMLEVILSTPLPPEPAPIALPPGAKETLLSRKTF